MNSSHLKMKILLCLVGAFSGIAGIILTFYGLEKRVDQRNSNYVLVIAIGAILDFVGHKHLRWLSLYGVEENFNYKKKLKVYIPLWIILLLIVLIECYLLIRDGYYFIQ